MATKQTPKDEAAQDISVAEPMVDIESIDSFDQAIRAFDSVGLVEIDGFDIVDKDALVGIMILITEWRLGKESNYQNENGEPNEFVVIQGITYDDKRFLITDGGVGILPQLRRIAERTGRTKGILLKTGLTKSEYTYTDDKGRKAPAVTYYLGQ